MQVAAPVTLARVAQLTITPPGDSSTVVPRRTDLTIDRSVVLGRPEGYSAPEDAFDAAWQLSEAGGGAMVVEQSRAGVFRLHPAYVDGDRFRFRQLIEAGATVRAWFTRSTVLALVDAPAYISRW